MSYAPAIQEARENPLFILEGPGVLNLPCQWTSFDKQNRIARTNEFEVILPELPETIGCLFGVLEGDEFRMRPAIRNGQLAPELDLDQNWRGGPDDVLEAGDDLEMGDDGLYIYDAEEPAVDPDVEPETAPLRRAA